MPDHRISIEPSPKRLRAMFNGKTIADSLCAALMLEDGELPVYYFPRDDVRMDHLEPTSHRTHCAFKGDAIYWTLKLGDRVAENAVWSYENPLPAASRIAGWLAFQWDKVDNWFEEDEEVFGHPHDPHHLIDIRPSSRTVRVTLGTEQIAFTRKGLFLFETGLPTRYYFPPEDVRKDLFEPSALKTTCAYKGEASYWSLRASGKLAENAVWSYLRPNPEYQRIKGYYCFYPEKVDLIEVEGERAIRGSAVNPAQQSWGD
jgi:uncharacterized protein (DUF427 family)